MLQLIRLRGRDLIASICLLIHLTLSDCLDHFESTWGRVLSLQSVVISAKPWWILHIWAISCSNQLWLLFLQQIYRTLRVWLATTRQTLSALIRDKGLHLWRESTRGYPLPFFAQIPFAIYLSNYEFAWPRDLSVWSMPLNPNWMTLDNLKMK